MIRPDSSTQAPSDDSHESLDSLTHAVKYTIEVRVRLELALEQIPKGIFAQRSRTREALASALGVARDAEWQAQNKLTKRHQLLESLLRQAGRSSSLTPEWLSQARKLGLGL